MSRGAKEAEQRENRKALGGVENTCKSGDQGSWGSWWTQFARLVGPQDCNKCPLRRLHDWSSFRVRAVLRAPICCVGNRGVAHAREAVSEPKRKGRIDFSGGLCAQTAPEMQAVSKPIRCIALLLHGQLTRDDPIFQEDSCASAENFRMPKETERNNHSGGICSSIFAVASSALGLLNPDALEPDLPGTEQSISTPTRSRYWHAWGPSKTRFRRGPSQVSQASSIRTAFHARPGHSNVDADLSRVGHKPGGPGSAAFRFWISALPARTSQFAALAALAARPTTRFCQVRPLGNTSPDCNDVIVLPVPEQGVGSGCEHGG